MRRCSYLLVIGLAFLTTACGASSETRGDQDKKAIYAVRLALPSIEAYYVDHNGYTGVTLAKLQEYNPAVADISVVSASKDTYCIEAQVGSSRAFRNGPSATIMLGSCSKPGVGREYTEPEEAPNAVNSLRSSLPSIEAYHWQHKTYLGMTLQKLRQGYNQALPDIEIVSADKSRCCVEITVNGESAHLTEPAMDIEPGHCPHS